MLKMKQQHDINVRRTQKKFESHMGFEPTTLCDLVRCSNQWTTGDSMVSKGQFVGVDWNRIKWLHSKVMTGTQELTNSIALSHESISRCSQPTSKVSMLKMKQQQHDIKCKEN